MPEFSNINSVFNPMKKMNSEELLRAIKFAIASEFEAIQIYQQIAASTSNRSVKTVLLDIAKEEKEHVGELRELLKILSPEDEIEYEAGAEETRENLEK